MLEAAHVLGRGVEVLVDQLLQVRDERLIERQCLSMLEGPKRRTREEGSELEPIKILFKNWAYEPNFTRAPPQAFLAKFTLPLKCY
jgi:hypothetical protein